MDCKGCHEEIVGFDVNGYCESCLCPGCGTELVSEQEQGDNMCNECVTAEESE